MAERETVGTYDPGAHSGADGSSSTSDGNTGGHGDGTTGTTGGGSQGTGTDDGYRLDVGHGDDGGPGNPCDQETGENCSCTSVDLLFVIDNSSSMSDAQQALGEAFPAFADAIIESLPPGTNLHVGVTSSEMGMSSSGNTMNCTATGDDGQPQEAFYVTADMQDTGRNGAQGRLFVADGRPFYEINTDASQAEVDALKDWFRAAAAVGVNGSNIEMTAAAAGWVADPANDGTNAGFIRDAGSVLVVFFVQDEPDQTPTTIDGVDGGQAMLDKLAAAKSACGGTDCIIGGGFVNDLCYEEMPLGHLLDNLGAAPATEPFGGDTFGSSPSAEQIVSLLRDTLAGVIAQKCDEIPPVG